MFDDFLPEFNNKNYKRDANVDISRFNVAIMRLSSGDIDIKLVQTMHKMHHSYKDKIDIPANIPAQLRWLLFWIHPFLIERLAVDDFQRKMMEWSVQESSLKRYDFPYQNTRDWDAAYARYGDEMQQSFDNIKNYCPQDDHLLIPSFMPNYPVILDNIDFMRCIKISETAMLDINSHHLAIMATGISLTVLPENIMTLFNIFQKGNKSRSVYAEKALEKIVRRKGMSGKEELRRQAMMQVARQDNVLAGERVKVGWHGEGWSYRLSLRAGKGRLEAISEEGAFDKIPAAARKTAGYADAMQAKKDIDEELKMVRELLENDMNTGFIYNIGTFCEMMKSPIFAHLAERIVWKSGDNREFASIGEGRWQMLSGENIWMTGFDAPFTVYPVHPVELHQEKTIAAWQSWAVDNRFTQPFRQIFREVYFPGEDEFQCGNFKGREVVVDKAYALLRTAGYQPGEGIARRVIAHGVTSCINWAAGKSNKEIYSRKADGIVSLGNVWFEKDGNKIALADVNPAFISEALRTADLLAAKASTGEGQLSSTETVKIRTALLRELVRAEGYANIVCSHDSPLVLVFGKLATYRVNISSGTIFLQPSGRQIELHTEDFDWDIEDNADDTAKIFGKIFTLAHDELIPDLFFHAQLY
jgi:hypothetical protein